MNMVRSEGGLYISFLYTLLSPLTLYNQEFDFIFFYLKHYILLFFLPPLFHFPDNVTEVN